MFPLKRDSNHQFSGDNYVSFKRPSGHTAIVIVATSMTQLHAESPNNPSLPGEYLLRVWSFGWVFGVQIPPNPRCLEA